MKVDNVEDDYRKQRLDVMKLMEIDVCTVLSAERHDSLQCV